MLRDLLLRRLSAVAILAGATMAALPAFAQIPVICTGLAGCGAGAENVLLTSTLPTAGALMIRLVAGGAVIFIVVAGTKMLIGGNDEKAGAAKKSIMLALGGLGLALAAGTIVSFVTTENYGQANPGDFLFGAGGLMESAIRIIMTLFNVAFIIVILYAGIQMVLSSGKADEFKKGGTMIKWAIVGAVLVNLSRAIVQAFLGLNI